LISFFKNIWNFKSKKFFIILTVVFIFAIALVIYVVKNIDYLLYKKIVYVVKIDDIVSYKYLNIDRLYNFLEDFKGDGITKETIHESVVD